MKVDRRSFYAVAGYFVRLTDRGLRFVAGRFFALSAASAARLSLSYIEKRLRAQRLSRSR
jgi:hypothetical protein